MQVLIGKYYTQNNKRLLNGILLGTSDSKIQLTEIDGIEKVEPMTFPFINEEAHLREDVATSTLTTDDAVKNANDTVYDEIKVPKVVGGES